MQDDLAIGMGAQAVLEAALAELDRGINARSAVTQRAVVLSAEFDAYRRLAAFRSAPGEGGAGPVLYFLDFLRPGHNRVLWRIRRDVAGRQGEYARSAEQKEQHAQRSA